MTFKVSDRHVVADGPAKSSGMLPEILMNLPIGDISGEGPATFSTAAFSASAFSASALLSGAFSTAALSGAAFSAAALSDAA